MNIKKIVKSTINLKLTILAYLLYFSVKYIIPFPIASLIGMVLGKYLLFFIPTKRKKEVIKNIGLCFPNLSKKEILKIYQNSCGNFLQNVFELPKFNCIIKKNKYIRIEDPHNILNYAQNNSVLFFSAHIGNWEFGASFTHLKIPNSYLIYKGPSNVFMERLFLKIRSIKGKFNHLITLNTKNILFLINQIKTNHVSIGMMVDQRIKEGLNVEFFNRPAKTSQFLPMLAIKYNAKLCSMRVIRRGLCKFTIQIGDLVEIDNKYFQKENQVKGIEEMTQKINDIIQQWIQEYPNQWFWLHRRW